MRTDVLAIVVNYNAGDWLKACLDSLLGSQYPTRIRVVDNASTDHSLVGLAGMLDAGEGVQLIRNAENVGFARANNQVLRIEEAEFYVLVNPDCVVEADTIGELIAVMRGDNDIGLASCLIRNSDGSTQKTCRRRFPTPWSGFVRTFGLASLFPGRFDDFDLGDMPHADGVEYVDAVSGAFMVVRGSALDRVGYLDEGYFMHCEDLDWCKRFWQAGFKVGFVADTQVTHKKGVSGRSLRVNWHLHQGILRFYRKFYISEYPKLLSGLVYVGVFISFLLKSAAILVRGRHDPHPKPLPKREGAKQR